MLGRILPISALVLATYSLRASAQLIAPVPRDSMRPILPDSVCAHRGSPFVGPCQTVHGRLFLTNGTPGARLWKVGTNRVLGVWEWIGEGSPCPLPTYLEKPLVKDDKVVFADFVIRPVTQSTPGYMQMVCVVSGSKMTTRPAYFVHPRPQ